MLTEEEGKKIAEQLGLSLTGYKKAIKTYLPNSNSLTLLLLELPFTVIHLRLSKLN